MLRSLWRQQERPDGGAEAVAMLYRQGDVLVIPTTGKPPDLAGRPPHERDDGRVVLQYGEVTGHAHAIADEQAALWQLPDGDAFLEVGGTTGVELRHEEHATILISPGEYIVRRQREFAPAENAVTLDTTFVRD